MPPAAHDDRRAGATPRPRGSFVLAADEVARVWDLGRWEDWQRTALGSTNKSFFVTTDRGRFVVRVSTRRKTEAAAAWEVALLDHLRSRGYPAPRVVPTRTGTFWTWLGERLGMVFERLPGAFPDITDPGHLAESARALARFHQEAAVLPPAARPAGGSRLESLAAGPGALARARPLARAMLAREDLGRFERSADVLSGAFHRLAGLALAHGAMPRMVIHGSYGASAVLFDGPRLTGVLDYERAAHDARGVDLAYALRSFTRDREAPPEAMDLARLERFLAAYQSVEPLDQAELAALPDALRAQRLIKVVGKAANLVAKHASTPQEGKDLLKLTRILELEADRLRWLDDHEPALAGAAGRSRSSG